MRNLNYRRGYVSTVWRRADERPYVAHCGDTTLFAGQTSDAMVAGRSMR